MQGKIVKGIAGFYYVHVPDKGIYECKAKGIFRKENQKPLVGDDVEIQILNEEEAKGNIEKLLPRKSELIRPAVANIDQALVIFAIVKPQPNFNLLDRFLIMMEQQGIPCIICFNKADIDEKQDGASYEEIYRSCGYETIQVSAKNGQGLDALKEKLVGKTTTVAGPSGVGKSSIINELQSSIRMETGAISTKIERGRHTTRHSELIAMEENTYILDTPGFSSLGLFDMEKEDLTKYYREFVSHEKYCKFAGCAHMNEPVCGVKEAVADGEIAKLRYENYKLLYQELKDRKKY
ncbi:MAG: ribosome small subunit-dependent GTPase A [Lachnospiraceae bacterium]|nr:ribosome small subunit-dependent GTPase A [Lachnospiraceae bacterium]